MQVLMFVGNIFYLHVGKRDKCKFFLQVKSKIDFHQSLLSRSSLGELTVQVNFEFHYFVYLWLYTASWSK